MSERAWSSEDEGEFGDAGNPPGAKAPKGPGVNELGGEANPPGIRPEDQAAAGEGEGGDGAEEGLEARRADKAGRPTNE